MAYAKLTFQKVYICTNENDSINGLSYFTHIQEVPSLYMYVRLNSCN